MKLVRRDPAVAYLDTWLWLPKSYVTGLQVRSNFSYLSPRNGDAINAWAEEVHHYRVPRNFLSQVELGQLPFPVYDTRFKDFPRIDLVSRVTLDAKEPTKTYQREASDALLRTYDGILCLRCGAGKTVVCLHTAAQVKQPILVLVTDKGLKNQWIEEIEQWLGLSTKDIGQVGGDGQPFDWEKPITVALVQTIAKRVADKTLPLEFVRHFGVVVPDEAHLMGAPYFNQALPPFPGRRWGLSATPVREDGFDSLLRYTCGNVIYTYLMPDLKPTVYFKRLPTNPNFAKKDVYEATHDRGRNLHFGMLFSYFGKQCHERTDAIAKEIRGALNEGRQVLVLTHSRDMCDALEQRFPDAGICHADVKEKERVRRIRECNPVIAIMQLGKQALNKPSLDTLFVCEPFTKGANLQQTMGRVLRSFSGKKSPAVVFFEDVKIKPLFLMCNKLRRSLAKWPNYKGGAILFKILSFKEEGK